MAKKLYIVHRGVMTKYPFYSVEGRRFESDHFQYAVAFARRMAAQMARPVHVIRELDHMTAPAVIYTAEPEEAGR